MGITYRSEKGSPLTIDELDNNFRALTGSQSVTGSMTVSGSVTTVDASGSLGTSEKPWKDLYITNNTLVISDGINSASIDYPAYLLGTMPAITGAQFPFTSSQPSVNNTGSYNPHYLDNGGGMTLQFSGSVLYKTFVSGTTNNSWDPNLPPPPIITGSETGSELYTITTNAMWPTDTGYSQYFFSKRDINNYSYSTGSTNLYGIITASARESDSFLVRIYVDEAPNKSVMYTNSGSVELVNIDPVTGEGDLEAWLKPIGGKGVGYIWPTLEKLNGKVLNASFQVSKTAPFAYTDSGSFLVSGSISGNDLTFNRLDGTSFSLALGGQTTIYNGDSSLDSNRIVDLDGNTLTFTANNGENFVIDLDNGANVKIPNLLLTSSDYVLSYNNTSGQLSYISTGSLTNIGTYTYVPSNGNTSKQISGSVKLPLNDIDSIPGGSSFPTVNSDEITIQQDGVYKIEYNAMITSSTSAASNSWWSVQLKLNQGGNISYPVINYAVEAGPEPFYGSTHLLYVGNLNTNDVISFLGNTPDPTIDHLRGRVFVRKIS